MKRWIRAKGMVAFVVVSLLMVLVWVLVVDTVIRRTIETAGTRAAGARVDLAGADLSLFPSGLELTGLAVTNPDSPMQNIVEIGSLRMDLDPGYLIRRKIIINAMAVEGLRFNTPRKTSGEVPELAEDRHPGEKSDAAAVSTAAMEKVCGKFTMPALSIPDVDTILAGEPLEALTLATGLGKKIEADQARWEKALTRLADEKTLAAYRDRVEKIKGTGGAFGALLGNAGEIQQLQADIRNDLNRLKEAQTAFTADFKDYQNQVRDLSNAPVKDINRIMDKYSLSPSGLANMSRMLFGERLCGWLGTATGWYRKIEPHIGRLPGADGGAPEQQAPRRGKGQNIRFAETPPMPDFLIRSMKVSAAVAAGSLTGKAENITLAQHILGRPMTFAFLGREMKQINMLNLIGTADYVRPDAPGNHARLTISGLALKHLPLVREGAFPLTLQQATGDLSLTLQMEGTVLDADLQADFKEARFLTAADAPQTAIGTAIGSAISGVSRFSLSAGISGTLAAYTVDVASDLDQVLRAAAGNLVRKEAARFESALTEQVSNRMKGPVAQARESLAGLGGIDSELSRRLRLGNDLLGGMKLPF
ncbi:hypothetical protein DSCA_21750 [Desulfosarcina alkanivorans]|uniref:TIGR03545 family protein n=1 Tax=Desulfosarcina alkanivorans TaxID=571177 RepID=A0A5K7YIN5_9BACT|nr:TIGR03545 family protein [Desulfosarcina alkanivorans]BBO68245.1 hypothetical protein DSCA_21750 [Desulfosarcina alkanivorans]